MMLRKEDKTHASFKKRNPEFLYPFQESEAFTSILGLLGLPGEEGVVGTYQLIHSSGKVMANSMSKATSSL